MMYRNRPACSAEAERDSAANALPSAGDKSCAGFWVRRYHRAQQAGPRCGGIMMSVWRNNELRSVTKQTTLLLFTSRLRDRSNFESKRMACLVFIQAFTVSSSFGMIY